MRLLTLTLTDAGTAGWLLLILLLALAGAVAAVVARLVIGLLLMRHHGQHQDRAGMAVTSSLAAIPTGSMQLDDDLEAWEAHWWREFKATHPASQVEAAFDQRGGWVSGACDTPLPQGSGAELPSSWLPAPEVTSDSPRGGDGGGPAHMGAGPPPPAHEEYPTDLGRDAGLILSAGYNSHLPPPGAIQAKVDSPAPDPEPIWPPVCSSEQWLRELKARAAPGWTYAGGIAA